MVADRLDVDELTGHRDHVGAQVQVHAPIQPGQAHDPGQIGDPVQALIRFRP
jgi:hypothetical protein